MMSRIAMSKSNLDVNSAFDLFIRKCKIKNLTVESINSYQRKIMPFKKYTAENPVELADISADTIDNYIIWMRNNLKANDISINSYLRAVRAFLYFSMDNGYLTRFKVHMPKAEKKMKETYSEAELKILLKKPDTNHCTFTTYKTWVFENFMLGTGMRISTAINLHISDIHFDDGLIFLGKLKNRKQQYIPLSNIVGQLSRQFSFKNIMNRYRLTVTVCG